MSLAMFAASINDNSNITLPNNSDNNDNLLNQKRHKRTQRKYPKIENFDTNKVANVLEGLHNSATEDDEDDSGSFYPPPKPESSGVQKTIPQKETFGGMDALLGKNLIGKAPSPTGTSDKLDLNDYGIYGDNKTIDEYYRNVIPGYNQQRNNVNQGYHQTSENINVGGQDVLLQKLNYMISLLEEQQDEKTDNVTEEVILYSFLGIFIIFMADTFVRAGKYTR